MLRTLLSKLSKFALPKIRVLGIDIQEQALTIAIAERKAADVVPRYSETTSVPPGTIVDGLVKDPTAWGAAVHAALANVPKHARGSHAVASISIPPHHVYTETFFLPSISEEELARTISLRLETSLPWPVADAYFDWTTFAAIGPDSDQTGVFLVATRKKWLEDFLDPFLAENVRIGAVEFHFMSLLRLLGETELPPTILVFRDGDGAELAAVANRKILTHYLEKAPVHFAEIESRVKQIASYMDSNYGTKPEQVLFSDVAHVLSPGKTDMLAGIPATPMTFPGKATVTIALALGASLRPYTATDTEIDLLPPHLGGRYREYLRRAITDLWMNLLILILGIFLAAFGLSYAFLRSQQDPVAAQTKGITDALARQAAQAAPISKDAAYFNALTKEVADAETATFDYSRPASAAFQAIAASGGTFVSMQATGPGVIVVESHAPTRQAALDFKSRLTDAGVFKSITIPINQLTPLTDLRIVATLTF